MFQLQSVQIRLLLQGLRNSLRLLYVARHVPNQTDLRDKLSLFQEQTQWSLTIHTTRRLLPSQVEPGQLYLAQSRWRTLSLQMLERLFQHGGTNNRRDANVS